MILLKHQRQWGFFLCLHTGLWIGTVMWWKAVLFFHTQHYGASLYKTFQHLQCLEEVALISWSSDAGYFLRSPKMTCTSLRTGFFLTLLTVSYPFIFSWQRMVFPTREWRERSLPYYLLLGLRKIKKIMSMQNVASHSNLVRPNKVPFTEDLMTNTSSCFVMSTMSWASDRGRINCFYLKESRAQKQLLLLDLTCRSGAGDLKF